MKSLTMLACAAGMFWAGVAGAITIEGIESMQVVQVDAGGTAVVALSGKATGARAEVLVENTRRSGIVAGWEALGDISGGKYSGELRLQEGGPYRVSVRSVDASGAQAELAEVSGVLAGDLWVLAGQSNMQGVGNLDEHVLDPHPLVNVLRMNHEWALAAEPLHILGESPDPVHGKFDSEQQRVGNVRASYEGTKGATLGMAFAQSMVEATGRPVGLVATAHGGTSLEQWNPAYKDKGGDSLYGSMLAQVKKAGGKVRGVLWYQGESDANPKDAPTYGDRFKTLILSMREDFGGAEMPFYYVQIGRFVNPGVDAANWNKLRAEQLRVEADIAPGAMVGSIDLDLDDAIHIGTPGLNMLGQRMALLAQRDLFGTGSDIGPRFSSMETFSTPYERGVRVNFTHVNDALAAAGRLGGFEFTDGPEGPVVECIYKQDIDPQNPTSVRLFVQLLPANAQLWYGRGENPYCNLSDKRGHGLPTFGPMPVPQELLDEYVRK